MAAAVGGRWQLPARIIEMSEADEWNTAIEEWQLDDIELLDGGEEARTCLCSHYPIREVCKISNKLNENKAEIGNCCILKFGFEETEDFKGTHKIFAALKRIKEGPDHKSANKELIDFAFESGALNDWEKNYYLDIWKKRKLTDRQKAIRSELNENILLDLATSVEQAVERIRGSLTKSASRELIDRATEREVFTAEEAGFYLGIWRKAHAYLSNPQRLQKKGLNQRILENAHLILSLS